MIKGDITCIYVISSLGGGGAESQLLSFAIEAKKIGVVPIVCALKSGGKYEDRFRTEEIETFIIGGRNTFKHISRLRKLVLSRKPNILHAHMSYSDLVCRVLKKLTNVPLIVTQHGLGRWKGRIHLAIDRLSWRLVDCFVTVSEKSREIRLQREGYSVDRVEVIPNGVSDTFLSGRAVELNDEYIFGSVARLTDVKRIDILIEAFYSIVKIQPNSRLQIIGDGPNLAKLVDLAHSLGIEKKVEFLGWKDNVKEIISNWFAFILPSISEDCPVSLLEAMGLGVVPIASNVGGIPEIVVDKNNGLLFDPESVVSLEECMRRLMEDIPLWRKYSERAADTIRAKYSIKLNARRVVSLYKRILQEDS